MTDRGIAASQEPATAAASHRIRLRYFEDVLPVEFAAIIQRRMQRRDPATGAPRRGWIEPLVGEPEETSAQAHRFTGAARSRQRSPDPRKLPFGPQSHERLNVLHGRASPGGGAAPTASGADPISPTYDKTRPEPVPCTVNGLAFSGGGIRSAAVCLGALQALAAHNRIAAIDYLSTVSGGGYIGSCLSAAMSSQGGNAFPFGGDVYDSPAVAHLRNYSNYLLPRGRSGVRNAADATAVLARGILANFVLVLATILGFALATQIAYPNPGLLLQGSFLPRFLDGVLLQHPHDPINGFFGPIPFSLTLWSLAVLAADLIIWAVLRSIPRLDPLTDDAQSWALAVARCLIIWTAAMAFLDLQPMAVAGLIYLYDTVSSQSLNVPWKTIAGGLTGFSTAISVLSSWLGSFLKTSQHATSWTTIALRVATYLALVLAALVLPVALWAIYVALSAWSIECWPVPGWLAWLAWGTPPQMWQVYIPVFVASLIIWLCLSANGYSLHRLYRDRLSKAFLFNADPHARTGADDPPPLDSLKLSGLENSVGPYHIINSAMNVEGSAEANRRGRNADFFMFTRDFVGSDLTLYTRTQDAAAATDMERVDPRLDLATAMAISGAAISANMGAETIRLLSPTLALLNIRLGYWMRNPRDLAMGPSFRRGLRQLLRRFLDKFYLLAEMLNLLDETSPKVYLTDGGHIENLGIYELLKRGCQLIVVVDVEADPSMSFGSLLIVERYARIDLGVRIILPWEGVADMTKLASEDILAGRRIRHQGPHCAVGRILYQDGAQGIIVYFKSSLTGDEKDYVLDYKKRYPAFPHETTGDQFFSEEQFEAYRALGYHMVDSFFGGSDDFTWLDSGPGAFASRDDALAQVMAILPAMVPTAT